MSLFQTPDSVTRKNPGSGLLGPNQILADFNVFDIYNYILISMIGE